MKTKSALRAGLMMLTAVLATAFLPSCNTTKGLGRDVRQAGAGIEHAADRAR